MPGRVFAIAVTLATPLASVMAVLLENVADASTDSPVGGANVTVAPLTGFGPFFTVTCSGVGNAARMVVD